MPPATPCPEITAMDAGAAAAAGGGLDDPADSASFSRRGYRRRRRCCCFPWLSSSSSSPNSSSSPHARRADEDWWQGIEEGGPSAARRKWWRRGADALMKVREWSELVAGPRWKTFIRRFRGRVGPRHGAAATGAAGGGTGQKLNYDPLSYALNFDEGHGGSPEGGDYTGYRDFSARFVAKTSQT